MGGRADRQSRVVFSWVLVGEVVLQKYAQGEFPRMAAQAPTDRSFRCSQTQGFSLTKEGSDGCP